MTVRNALIIAVLLLCQPAIGQMETLVDAVETSSNNIIVPPTISGTVTFRPCAGECDKEYKRARLTAETRFALDGKGVKFEEFRRVFAAKRHSDSSYALVSYNTETNTITEIAISR